MYRWCGLRWDDGRFLDRVNGEPRYFVRWDSVLIVDDENRTVPSFILESLVQSCFGVSNQISICRWLDDLIRFGGRETILDSEIFWLILCQPGRSTGIRLSCQSILLCSVSFCTTNEITCTFIVRPRLPRGPVSYIHGLFIRLSLGSIKNDDFFVVVGVLSRNPWYTDYIPFLVGATSIWVVNTPETTESLENPHEDRTTCFLRVYFSLVRKKSPILLYFVLNSQVKVQGQLS